MEGGITEDKPEVGETILLRKWQKVPEGYWVEITNNSTPPGYEQWQLFDKPI